MTLAPSVSTQVAPESPVRLYDADNICNSTASAFPLRRPLGRSSYARLTLGAGVGGHWGPVFRKVPAGVLLGESLVPSPLSES